MLGGINQIIGHDIDEIYIRVYGLYINIFIAFALGTLVHAITCIGQ